MTEVSFLLVVFLVGLSLTLTLAINHRLPSHLSFELPDNERICFGQDFTDSKNHLFDFHVVKGGKLDVDVSIETPNGQLMYRKARQSKGTFKFVSTEGSFNFCFSNEFSTFTHKVVYFSLRPEVPDTLIQEAQAEEEERSRVNTQIEQSLENIHRSNTAVMDFQTDYRLKESRGYHRAQELNLAVHWWSLGQTIFIIVAGLGQVIVLKAFFTDRTRRSRISLSL